MIGAVRKSRIRVRLALAALLLGCAPEPKGRPQDAAVPAPPADPLDQGIAGRFEVMAGAHPRDPGCGGLASPAARDSCESESRRRMGGALRGSAIIVNAAGDSLASELDSLGGFRARVPPGVYTVCFRADGMPAQLPPHIRCQDKVEVEPGKFTPFSRVLPMP